jgi:hypothetical protein
VVLAAVVAAVVADTLVAVVIALVAVGLGAVGLAVGLAAAVVVDAAAVGSHLRGMDVVRDFWCRLSTVKWNLRLSVLV